jgi:hypothetical protein
LFPGGFAFNLPVHAKGDTLIIPAGSRSRRFVRTDSLLLQEVSDGTRAVLRRDASGRISMLYTGAPTGGAELPGAFERLPWYQGAYFLNEYISGLLGIPIIVLGLWGLVSATTWAWRRRRRPVGDPARVKQSRAPLIAVVLTMVATAVFAWFGFGFIAAGTRDLSRSQGMAFGMTTANIAMLRLAWILALAAIPTTVFAVRAWRHRWWNWFGRLSYSVLALNAIAVAHFLVWFRYVPGRW